MQRTDSRAIDKGCSSVAVDHGPVLFLMNALGVGGSERKTVSVANELHRRKFRVHIAYLDNRTPLLKELAPGVSSVYLARRGRLSFSAVSALRRYLERESISRIVCVSLYPLIYAVAAVGMLGRRQRPSVTLMVNATQIGDWKTRGQMVLYRPLMKLAERVVFGCRVQMDLWCGRYGIDRRRCSVIYNGIDERRFQPTVRDYRAPVVAPAGIGPDDFLIGAVGTLWPNKNHAELVGMLRHAQPKLPAAKLVIAGEGPERQRLLAAAESAGLGDRVLLLGEVEDVRPFLDRVDVFVLPSISETFSNAVLEAMAMEKVVVVSDTGGMREMVTDGVDGYVYKQGDVSALTALIVKLAMNAEKRRDVGESARRTVRERFTFDRMVDEYIKLLA